MCEYTMAIKTTFCFSKIVFPSPEKDLQLKILIFNIIYTLYYSSLRLLYFTIIPNDNDPLPG